MNLAFSRSHGSGSFHDLDCSRNQGLYDKDDLLSLWAQPLKLFRLANDLGQRSCKDVVTFVINRNINFTNRCTGDCSFCAFRKSDGYMLSGPEILQRVEAAEKIGATEICLQGGLAPELVLEDYCEILELIRQNYPRMHLHAYSPMEVLHMSRNSSASIEDCLIDLKRSGLGSMPGTAAEILVDTIRSKICPKKLCTSEWCHIISAAHELGIPTTSTMLYGHIESLSDRLSHLRVLLDTQKKTGGFTEFVLLPFIPGNNRLGLLAKTPNLLEHLKMHALSRVALYPHIVNIQASWTKLGRIAAGAAIEWGANDLGGTLMEENISRSAGSREAQFISPDELIGIIERHGRTAAQRTTLYGRL